jgi:hypothetical protein
VQDGMVFSEWFILGKARERERCGSDVTVVDR